MSFLDSSGLITSSYETEACEIVASSEIGSTWSDESSIVLESEGSALLCIDWEVDECRGADADWFSARDAEDVSVPNEETVGVPLLATVRVGAAAEFTGTREEAFGEGEEGETVD